MLYHLQFNFEIVDLSLQSLGLLRGSSRGSGWLGLVVVVAVVGCHPGLDGEAHQLGLKVLLLLRAKA